VVLQIFDTKGYRIKDLFRGRQEKGAHEIAWDGTDDRGNRVASGVYFIRVLWHSDLSKDAAMRTGKIMLLK
jgi:flagellar hook assembly protein FlgD